MIGVVIVDEIADGPTTDHRLTPHLMIAAPAVVGTPFVEHPAANPRHSNFSMESS